MRRISPIVLVLALLALPLQAAPHDADLGWFGGIWTSIVEAISSWWSGDADRTPEPISPDVDVRCSELGPGFVPSGCV
ncbi:MAG: hypothetical protein AAGN66_27400 [Acidobacteriota bacterium]